MEKQVVKITTDFIELSALLKWANVVASGGEAKHLILSGAVKVNDQVTTQRAKKIFPGDKVTVDDKIELIVE